MKKSILSITIILTILLSGCFSYRDMNRLQFITMGIQDIGEDDEVVIYGEQLVADRGSGTDLGSGVRIVLDGKGVTLSAAYEDMQRSSSHPMTYDVNKSLVFTERLARRGLQEYMDSYERSQEATLKQFLFIFQGEPFELLNVELEDELYIGVFLEEMMLFQAKQPRLVSLRLNEYLNNSQRGSRISVVPLIGICKEAQEERLQLQGAGILVNHTLVDKITPEEITDYKAMINDLDSGQITAENPQEKNKLVTLSALSTRTKDDIEYDGEDAILTLNMSFKWTVDNVEGKLNLLDPKQTDQLLKNAQEARKSRCLELFERFQEKGVDLLDVQMMIKKKYPGAKVDNDIIKNTTLKINVHGELEGGQYKISSEDE